MFFLFSPGKKRQKNHGSHKYHCHHPGSHELTAKELTPQLVNGKKEKEEYPVVEMRKANIRQAAHGQADKGNEAQGAYHQEGEDVKIQVSLKELRPKAGEREENGSRYAGAQHFRNIGTAADAAHRIEVGF